MASTVLLLMPFAWEEPLLHIYLLDVRINANVMQDIWQMTRQDDPLTAPSVLFRVAGALLVLVTSIAHLRFSNIFEVNLCPVLLVLERLKKWVMLDIYLMGIDVASIRAQDYTSLQPGAELFALIALVILSTLALSHLNVKQL